MKKLAVSLCAIFAFAALGNAMAITNPVYMPGDGMFMSETELSFSNTKDGDEDKIYMLTETLSYNFSSRFQLGGYISYAKYDTRNEKDFTNPGLFGLFRVIDTSIWQLDIGGEIELNVFDGMADGGVSDDVYKYGAIARTAFDLGAFSLGGTARLSYWDGDGAKTFNRDHESNITYGEAKAFAIFDVFDLMGIGAEAGYKVFDITGDRDCKGYNVAFRVDFNPIPSRLGVVAYVGYEDMDTIDEEYYTVGARLRVAI